MVVVEPKPENSLPSDAEIGAELFTGLGIFDLT